MKEALRYQQTPKRKKGKSGEPAKQSDEEEDGDDDQHADEEQLKMWKFYDCMKFVLERPERRCLI